MISRTAGNEDVPCSNFQTLAIMPAKPQRDFSFPLLSVKELLGCATDVRHFCALCVVPHWIAVGAASTPLMRERGCATPSHSDTFTLSIPQCNINLSEDDLASPTPERVHALYSFFVRICTGTKEDEYIAQVSTRAHRCMRSPLALTRGAPRSSHIPTRHFCNPSPTQLVSLSTSSFKRSPSR